MIEIAHEQGVPVLVDGAQAVPHMKVDVQDLDAEFYVFSGHKIYGPTGIGVLYGKEEWLDKLPPYQGGGEMIATVSFEKTTFNELPFKFEAGTPDYIGSTALAEALRYVIAHYKEKKQEIPTSYIKYTERSYLLQKGSALELLQKEISALESVQREIIQNITRAKYGLSETGENKRKKIFD